MRNETATAVIYQYFFVFTPMGGGGGDREKMTRDKNNKYERMRVEGNSFSINHNNITFCRIYACAYTYIFVNMNQI